MKDLGADAFVVRAYQSHNSRFRSGRPGSNLVTYTYTYTVFRSISGHSEVLGLISEYTYIFENVRTVQ